MPIIYDSNTISHGFLEPYKNNLITINVLSTISMPTYELSPDYQGPTLSSVTTLLSEYSYFDSTALRSAHSPEPLLSDFPDALVRDLLVRLFLHDAILRKVFAFLPMNEHQNA